MKTLHFVRMIKSINYRLISLNFRLLSLFFIISLSLPEKLFASFTGSVTTTESTCQANGTVKVSGTDNSSVYALTGSNIPQLGPFSPSGGMVIFTDLPPGTYTVTEYKLNNEQPTSETVVTGNYEQNWTWTTELVYSPCSGGTPTVKLKNFNIIGASPGQQRPPYVYRISSKDNVLPANGAEPPVYQMVTEFIIPYPAGVGGWYELQAKDYCGNFKTISIYVPDEAPAPSANFAFNNFINCDGDAKYTVDASGGTGPYKFEILSGSTDQVGLTYTNVYSQMYNFKADGYYKIKVTDQCGGSTIIEIYVADYGQPTLGIGGGLGKCGTSGSGDPGTGMLGITSYQYGIGPYNVEINSDCGYSQSFTNVSTYFEIYDLPRPCNYTIKVTDGCGFMNTYYQNLIGPGIGNLSCGTYPECPESNSELIRQVVYFNYGPPYNPTYPVTFDIKKNGILSIPGYPKSNYFDYYVREALSPGIYTYSIMDACGSSCSGTFEVLTYKNPTLTVDVNTRCFSAGQATLNAQTFNPFNLSNTPGQYSIIDPSASRVGATGESDSPPNSALFSNLISEGFYTFQFWDGCKVATATATIPKYSQPTWEVGYGLICPPKTVSDLKIINIQPQGQIVGPYYWQIISEDSDIFNDPTPYPNAIGQTDSLFANLPPKNAVYDVATYNILGYDGCKNSYQNQGKIGLFPDESLILNKTSVCADKKSKITARVSIPIVGATYKYYRDGILVATSNLLFTTISPAYPGVYTAEIVVQAGETECSKTTPGVVVTADGVLYTQNPEPKCTQDIVDLTQYTQGSSVGNISFWKDSTFTIPVADPTMVIDPGIYYVHLITTGPPECDLSGIIEVTLKPCKFDLALRKTLVSSGSFKNGDDVTFKVEVFNQGQTNAYNVQISDYIPIGMTLSPTETNWTVNSGKAILINPIPSLAINESTIRNITLRIDNNFMGSTIRNWAEISSADNDTNPLNDPPIDFDSDPDNINFNQPEETNDLEDDNIIDEDRKHNGGDEDDHDPEEISVIQTFDLALKKTVSSSGPFQPGSNVNFQIEIINQGTLDAKDIQIADYIPSGMSLDDPLWTGNPATLISSIPFLGVGQSTTRSIKLKIDLSFNQNSLRNWAEISSAKNDLGLDDLDSKPDAINFNQPGETNDLTDDNVINQDGKNGGDEDDHDPAEIDVVLFDLALKKVVDVAGPYSYGQAIPFRIRIYNQGGVPAKNIEIVDYIPSGFDYAAVNNPLWTFNGTNKAYTTITSTLVAGDSIDVIIYLTLKANPGKINAYLNYAEIKSATDVNGNTIPDVDSTPDEVNGNDTGGVPNSPTDNQVNGVPPTDEDDHDPALINVWDLALKKVFTSGIINYGNNLTFTIWVYNQGTETAKDIVIKDYIPEGYSFQAGLNPLWSNTYPNVTRTIAGPIVPGDSTSVTIVLTFENNVGGYKKWINYSEITSSKDLNNVNRSADDIDSNVGSDGPSERAVLPGRVNDNNIASTNKGGEEDDHDPAGAGIDFGDLFDLALRKTVITAGPYSYGQDVDFNIRIFNQGSITAKNINVVDYVPSGFQFIAGGVNVGWSYSVGTGIANRTITGPLLPGDSLNVTIRLRVLANPGKADAYINFSEIKSAQDTLGVVMTDVDSQPDDDPLNDIGGEPGGPTDDEINDDGTVDEDDHDPAMINLYDLALRKVILTNGPYTLGQVIDFNISVYNQGTLPVKNVVVNDYIPVGYTYNAGDNAGVWTGAHPLVMHTYAPTLNPGDSFVVTLKLRLAPTQGGYTDWYNYSEIRSMQSPAGTDVSAQDVDSDPNQDTPGERAVVPGSTNDNNITDITKVGDQDDHDPAGLSVFDLALRKTVITAGPYSYGQDIDFKIKVYNQGSVAAQNVNLVDYVPTGFQFIAGGVNTGWTYSAGNRQATRTLAGKLKPGDSAEVTIRLRLLANGATADAYTNLAEIKSAQDTTGVPGQDIDSNPDDDPTNDTGGEPDGPTDDEINQVPPVDEDDHDPAIINIFDLAIRKTLINPATGPYTYGQVHTFRVVVFNQGNMAATNISVKDYIPEGYSFSNNNGWTGGPSVAMNLINNTLQPGDSVELFINLTFNMVAVPSMKSWANYSEIAGANDDSGNPGKDVDSNPGSNGTNENNIIPGKAGDDDIASTSDTGFGSQDDHDPAGPWIFDLATIIENNVNQVSSYGEQVTFPIKVKNQGNVASAGYTLSVLVPSGFAFTQGPNTNWTYNNITKIATFIVPVTDTIKPGEMDMYNLILVAQPSNGADAWTVEVEISSDHPVADEPGINDIDSNPDAVYNNDPGGSPIPDSEGGNYPGSDDILYGAGNGNVGDTNAAGDEDDNDPEYVRVFDLALRKRLITPATGPYTYGQTHTFNVVVYNQGNVAAKDIVVNDYIPEGYGFSNNNGWTGGPNTASTTISNTILPGDSIVLTLNLTFKMVAVPTMKSWANYSEIASANDDNGNPGDDVDSDPGSNGPNEQNIIPGKPGDDDIASNSDTGFGSQDDHDPAGPWIFDLATIIENNVNQVSSYGEQVTFPIKVKNQGNIASAGYTLSVLVPSGFAFTQGPNANWSYNNVSKIATFIVPVTDTIKPGEMDMYNLILVAQPSNGKDAWTVEVEISADHPVADEAGINDIDSNPDAVFNNDPGGSPIPDSEGGNFPGSDDILNGAGNGNVGDTNAAGDEDDNDPEYVRVFDLALRKRLITPATGPYTYGQIHTFTVVVYNQGNVAAKDIVVNDYIPEGYSFSNNNGWTGGPNTASTTIANTILPGDSVVLTLNLTFNMVAHPSMKSWANYSEIASANDDEGNPGDDVDSDPGSNGPNEQNIIPGKPGDDDIASNSDTGFGSQDDHDPAGPWIFDLATKVENSTAEIHFYGELINFPIEVHNQGNIPTNGYTVSVNIPSGFAFNPAFNPNWVFDNGIGLFTYVSTNVLNPGETDQFNIVLTAQPSNGPNAWTVEVEISKDHPIADEVGIKDIDSKPDNNFSNDAGGSPLPDSEDGNYPGSDDILNGAGNGVIGGTSAAGDEDDNDPEFVQVFDLALRKTLVSPAAAPYTYGQNHTFKVTVFNQGNISATNILVSDFIPDGYSFTNNNGWTGGPNTITNLITSVIKPGDSVVLTLVLKFQMASQLTTNKTWINYAEITSAQDTLNVTRTDVDSEAGSNGPNENNVLPGKLGDDDISSNSDTGVGSQDDHDPAGPWIFDLATVIENSVDRISSYGELITFPIKVKNQGNIASAGYTLSVLVPDGFAFTQGPNTNWVYNNVTRIASYTVPVTDTIKPGEMDMYNIILTSQPASGKHAWTVEIEISSDNPVADEPGINDIDSNPDAVYNNDPGGAPIPDSEGGNFPGSDDILNGAGNGTIGDTNAAGDEDDNDPEYVKIYDLALKKLLDTPAPYVYDQNLTYRVRIFNQGNEPVRNVKIQDYIPVGFSLVPALSPSWVANANGAEYLYTGTLNPTDSIDFVITLKLKNTKGGYRDWINYAEITNMLDTLGNNVNSFDVDSRPASNGPGELAVTPGDVADNNITSINKGGEEDDHDPAGIQVFDVALRKNYIGTLPIKYNQVVPFEVTVFNQGNRSAQNFVIADYLAPGYEFDVPSNPNWTYNNITRIAKTTIAAKVIPGDSAKVTLYLAVKPTLYNKAAWKNFAEIVTVTDTTNTPGDDIDSDPDDNPNNDGPPKDGEIDEKPPVDEDDHDPAEPPVVDFALRKWIPGKKPYYIPGDTVDFVISLHNQGNVVSSAVGVNDYIPQGFQFLPAINAGWAFNGPRLEYTYGTRLYPEDSVQLHLKLKVIVAANPSIPDWENYAEIRSVRDTFNVNRDNDDADSKPNTDNAWERAVHDEDPWDDVIDGNNQIENEDSDDHDPEKVVVTAWIGDYVWKDLDGDGVQDNNEPGVPGVHVYLYKCSNGSLVKKDTTDASGKYEFDFLLSDDYFLRFDALPINMPNCAFTFRDKGGNDAKDSDVDAAGVTACTFLQWGERDSTWDAGLVELASYGDYVWHDRNANGIQEPGEEGVGGVQVTLYDAVTNLPVKTTTTDNNGLYLFEKLMPMQYYAKYDPPAGWNITTANVGNDTKDSDVDNSNGPRTNATTYLSPGENDRTWDLGIWQCVMIGGRVFFDVDKDGVFDASENGLNGLRINLIDYNSGSVVATLLTAVNPATPSDDGYYKFACVKPGSYYVQFERPGHLAASEPLRGGNADKDSDIGHENGVNSTRKIVVLSGDMVLNIGAGFQNKATVGDYVWLDRNLNGLQDSGEQPIPGVKVNAYNNTTGAMVSEATTGSDGHYMLDGIAQGDYYVKFIPPVNYGFTAAHSGTDPVDNDVDGTNGYGTTRVYRIQTGDALPTIDAGLVGAVLAIEWLNFTGHHNGSFTELNWQTGVELNNDHFEIERRHESETGFTVIGQELASEDGLAAKHNYGYDDFDANKSGVYYYRLKQVDKDGHFTYSKIISIQINRSTEFNVSIYPNPVDNLLKVDIKLGEESELEVRVFDKSGKNVLTNPFGGFRKAGTFNELLDTSILPAGQYNLQILTSHGIVNKQFTVLR